MAGKEKTFEYGVKNDGLNMWLTNNQGKLVHVHAINKILTLDEAQHEEVQGLIKAGRHDISQELTYLDRTAAEAIAKAHIAAHKGAAHQGPAHSQVAPEKSDTIKPVTTKEPAGMTLLEKMRASREGALATDNPDEKKPLEVVEETAKHADEIAPPSE